MLKFLFVVAIATTSIAHAEQCLGLYRLVEVKAPIDPDYRYWNDSVSYVSESLIPSIEGIFTPWSWKVRGEGLWFTDLELKGETLLGRLDFEKNEFPMDNEWDLIWSRPESYTLGETTIYTSRILDRDFRISMTLFQQSDARLCKAPIVRSLPYPKGSY